MRQTSDESNSEQVNMVSNRPMTGWGGPKQKGA